MNKKPLRRSCRAIDDPRHVNRDYHIRAAVCDRLAWLGVELDKTRNDRNAFCISTKASRVDVRVMATDEEAMIAHHVLAIIDGQKQLSAG